MSVEAPETEQEPQAEVVAPGVSVLDHLHARKDEIVQEASAVLTLPVPRWHDALGIRYEYPENGADVVIRAAIQAQQGSDAVKILDANLSLLVACCVGVVGRKPGGKWEPLDPSDDRPLRFGERLAKLLQIPVPEVDGNPAKAICRLLFSPRYQVTGKYEGDVALMTQGGQVLNFLQTGEVTAEQVLAGE